MVGTFRKNRREIPKDLTTHQNRELHSSIFCYTQEEDLQLVSYKAKCNKIVLLGSTQHMTNDIISQDNKKPAVIHYYNKTKGGVDGLDQRIGAYSVKWKSRRWHIPVFCDLVDISAYNAFILYTQCFPEWQKTKSHRRRVFLLELGIKLIADNRNAREISGKTTSSGDEKGRCKVCSRSNDRKTRSKCAACQGFVCEEHSRRVCLECDTHECLNLSSSCFVFIVSLSR